MTTQSELVQLAQKHADNPAVSILLTSLTESKHMAEQALGATQAICGSYAEAVKGTPGFAVSYDPSDLAKFASKAVAGIARMSADYSNLACVLQRLGEDISY
jgi:hypothetical protein